MMYLSSVANRSVKQNGGVMNDDVYVSYNANPERKRVGDCTVRAISKALGQEWEYTYLGLCLQGFIMHDMPSSDAVWGTYLHSKKFKRKTLENECPQCYTIRDFCEEYKDGTYIVALDKHVVAVVDGKLYDTWDSTDESPIYYWYIKKGEEINE
jgi:hypothetical protein